MAELIVSPLVGALFGKLVDEVIQEIKSVWRVEEEVDKLSDTLSTIKSVLEDAENKQLTEKTVKDWLRKLKDVAYDADDVLDEFAYEVLQSKVEGTIQTSNVLKKVRNSCFSCFTSNPLSFQRKMADQIQEIQKKLDEIAKERHNYHLNSVCYGSKPEIRKRPPTGSMIEEPVIGRKDDRDSIIKMLLSSDDPVSSSEIPVITLVGVGGLGKTTLARFVYNDERVVDNFPIRVWVCVSEDFDVTKLTKAIIESITENPCKLNEIDGIQVTLKKHLAGKKFLLILDDVWNDNLSDWLQLQAPLIFGAKGSRIIVTTRNLNVSKIMGTIPCIHHLEGLPHNEAWSLFSRRAFAVGGSNIPERLVEIGQEIVKKCQGLPLAIGALGGFLRCNMDETKWEGILKSKVWELTAAKENILPILKISYDHLPTHLKQCFAYCSLFPKDVRFDKDDLVKQWIAQGFIQPEHNRLLEDTGSDYFDELLQRSFFQHFHPTEDYYEMHDLVHDLAESISADEYLRIEIGYHKMEDMKMLQKFRHASFGSKKDEQEEFFEAFHGSKRLRTFMLLVGHENLINQVSPDFFSKLRYLRVLNLSSTGIKEVPGSIGNLKHLRYINLSHTGIRTLPKSITSLYNLQVLDLWACFELSALPKKLSNLVSLRHVILEGCHVKSMPPRIGNLTNLQALNKFFVGKEPGCGIGELKDLIYLRGDIRIAGLENVIDGREANLKEKHLRSLHLEWTEGRDCKYESIEEKVLEALEPHANLKELGIEHYNGVTFPRWMVVGNDFCALNLTKLTLHDCRNFMHLPSFSQLRFLETLIISRCAQLSSFPENLPSTLRELEIERRPNPETLPNSSFDNLTSLRDLTLSDYKQLETLPVDVSLEDLTICNCAKFHSFEGLPATLRYLYISGCPNLRSLPMLNNLSSLTYLHIIDCQQLLSLPEDGLPTMLRQLRIVGCPEIQRQCQEGGPYWPKISHIPDKSIPATES